MEGFHKAIRLIVHEGLDTYKKRNSAASLPQIVESRKASHRHKKGAICAIRSKEDLSRPNGVKGYVVTSTETLLADAPGLSHWTPNIYNFLKYSDAKRRYVEGHTEQNLQQINAFVVDIDSKKQPYTEILTAALDHSAGIPTMVLETPKGFQVYFVLESPLFISNENDFRGLKVAKRISENIRRSLSKVLQGVDITCNDFGFFRSPTEENMRWFSEKMTFTLHDLIAWSKRQDDDQNRSLFVAEATNQVNDPMQAEWFKELLTTRHVKGSSGQIGRDNLMYTIALACYSSGKGQDETLDLLDEYNSHLDSPVRHSEVRKIIKSAYKGRFKGANRTYIEELLSTWLPGKDIDVTTHIGGWHKFKKERKDRTRSHYDEWEEDVLAYIRLETSTAAPIKWSTQSEICRAIGIPRSTFNEVVRQSKKIMIKREGKGRGARTGLTSVAVLLESALVFNQTHRSLYYEALSLMSRSRENQHAIWEFETQLDLLTQYPRNRSSTGKNFNSS